MLFFHLAPPRLPPSPPLPFLPDLEVSARHQRDLKGPPLFHHLRSRGAAAQAGSQQCLLCGEACAQGHIAAGLLPLPQAGTRYPRAAGAYVLAQHHGRKSSHQDAKS